jgi:hypothetical protein
MKRIETAAARLLRHAKIAQRLFELAAIEVGESGRKGRQPVRLRAASDLGNLQMKPVLPRQKMPASIANSMIINQRALKAKTLISLMNVKQNSPALATGKSMGRSVGDSGAPAGSPARDPRSGKSWSPEGAGMACVDNRPVVSRPPASPQAGSIHGSHLRCCSWLFTDGSHNRGVFV